MQRVSLRNTFSKKHLAPLCIALIGADVASCGQSALQPAGQVSSPTSAESVFSPPRPGSPVPFTGCWFSATSPVSAEAGLNGVYAGSVPFTLVYTSQGVAQVVCLSVKQEGKKITGTWYVFGSCCEGGVVEGTVDEMPAVDAFGKLEMLLRGLDFDLSVDAFVASKDGNSFSGDIDFCNTDPCPIRSPEGPVTFTRQ